MQINSDNVTKIAKLERDLQRGMRKLVKYKVCIEYHFKMTNFIVKELVDKCSCTNTRDTASSVSYNIASSIEIQLDAEVEKLKSLSDWHLYTEACGDGRVNECYDLWNGWIQAMVLNLILTVPFSKQNSKVKTGQTGITRSMIEKDFISEFNSYSWIQRVHRSESIIASRLESKPTGNSMASYSTNKAVNTLYATNKNFERLVDAALSHLIGNTIQNKTLA